jgi:hypothetical protein
MISLSYKKECKRRYVMGIQVLEKKWREEWARRKSFEGERVNGRRGNGEKRKMQDCSWRKNEVSAKGDHYP